MRRRHPDELTEQKAVKDAVRRAKRSRPARCHVFRHSFATHLLEDACDIRTIQDWSGMPALRRR